MTSELASYEPQWWQNVVSLMKRNINEQQEGRLSRWLSVGALARKPEYWLQISKAHVNVDPPVILVLIRRSKGILEQAGKTENLLQLKRKGEQSKKIPKAREYRCAYTCIYTYMHAYMIIYEHTTHTDTCRKVTGWFHKLWEDPTSMSFNLWVLLECLLCRT